MKSVEVLLNESIEHMTKIGRVREFYKKRDAIKESTGKMPPIESQLQFCVELLKESESKPIKKITRNNGSPDAIVTESAIAEAQQRQIDCYKVMGLTEREAQIAAGVHDGKLKDLKEMRGINARANSGDHAAMVELLESESPKR